MPEQMLASVEVILGFAGDVMNKFDSVKTLKSRVIYNGPKRRLVADTVEFADKSNDEYVYFKDGGAVCVLACTSDNKVVLARQYRHPLHEVILNIPGGGVEDGEDIEKAAQREFEEETGFTTERLQWLGDFSPSPNSNVIVHLFFTRDFRLKGEFDKNETISVECVDFKALLQRVLIGECFDSALSIAVMLTALKKLV
jgi:ADP-ribose pyrophosphatase